MTAVPQHVDAFELLEQLRAAAEPLGLVVELRPAEVPLRGTWRSDRTPEAARNNQALILQVLGRQRGVWVPPREIAAVLDLPTYRLQKPLTVLRDAGRLEHNGRTRSGSAYRVGPNSSTPNDGDGEAEQAAATPVEGAGPDGRDPSPGDPADTNAAAAAGSPASIEDRAYDKGAVAAAAAPKPSASRSERAVPLRADLVPKVNRGALTAKERVRQSIAEDGSGTVSEIAARLRGPGYAKHDVAAAIFELHELGELTRSSRDGGSSVYRSAR